MWLVLLYLTGSYYWFWMTLRHVQEWDKPGTILLNAGFALLIGPQLIALTLVLRTPVGRLLEH